MIPKHPPKIGLRIDPGSRAASNQPSAFSQRGEAFEPTVTTHAVDDDIDAAFVGKISHFSNDVRRLVVDPIAGAMLLGLRQFVIAARCYNDLGAERGGNMESGAGDTTADTENKHRFAGLYPGVGDEHAPRCDINQRKRR